MCRKIWDSMAHCRAAELPLGPQDVRPMSRPQSLDAEQPRHGGVNNYQSTLVDLLAALGDDPDAYTAAAIRSFVRDRAKPHCRGRAQSIAVATRAWVKYLEPLDDACRSRSRRPELRLVAACVNSAPSRRGSERVIASCNGEDPLPSSRHSASRPSRLREARCEPQRAQIDWTNGHLTGTGKARREERLPWPKARKCDYRLVERSRSRVVTARVFQRTSHRFDRSAVSLRSALCAAPWQGRRR